jgi:hypothetical protein
MRMSRRQISTLRFTIIACISTFLLIGLSACLATPTPLSLMSTSTPIPPTQAPTPTIVWFPPTATFTPAPTLLITPTVVVTPQPGELVLSDDFTNPTPWTLGQTATTSIALGKSELTLALDQPGAYLYSLRKKTELDDFYLEITASPSLCKGPDEYGLLLRVSPSLDFYRFSLTCDGQVRLDKYFQGKASSPQPLTLSSSLPPGAPSSSRLGVWADGKELRFYINNEYQFTISDPSLTSGTLGVFIRSNGDNAVTVSFSDLEVYQAHE